MIEDQWTNLEKLAKADGLISLGVEPKTILTLIALARSEATTRRILEELMNDIDEDRECADYFVRAARVALAESDRLRSGK